MSGTPTEIPTEPIFVKSLHVKNFKSFEDFKIDFQDINVLVGVNNAGKSTILQGVRSCFNFLNELINERKKLDNKSARAAADVDSLNLANVKDAWHNKRQRTSKSKIIPIIFSIEFSNGIKVEIHLRQFYGQPHISIQNNLRDISKEEVLRLLKSNPILVPGFVGALVWEEYVTSQSVNRIIEAGRHTEVLRNVLLKLKETSPERFGLLNDIIQKYFGISLSNIKFNETLDEYVTTEYTEKNIELDIVMGGSGFLQFLQLLTFILSKKSSIVLLDEPDAHLHPSLQKILISVLTELSKNEHIQFIIATHSKEIVSHSDPRNIIYIDSENKEGKHLSSTPEIIDVLGKLGSIDHIDLALLLQTKKCLFVEGNEFKIIHQFANTLGIGIFQGNKQVIPIRRGGGNNDRYYDDLTVFRNFIGTDLKGYSIVDRDFKPDDLVASLIEKAKTKHVLTHVWNLHEIENYLLKPSIIEKIVNKKIDDSTQEKISNVKEIIIESSNEMRQDIEDYMSQTLIHWTRQKGETIEVSNANKKARQIIASKWNNWDDLIQIIPGKEILRKVKEKVQLTHNVSFGDLELASEMTPDDIDDEIKSVLSEIDLM